MTGPTSKTLRTKKLLSRLERRTRKGDDLVDVYTPSMVYLWYQLQSGDFFDLSPQGVGQPPEWNVDENSEQPEWWPWWLSDMDIQTALNVDYFGKRVEAYGREWNQPWRAWALENGIAPGQFFRVEMGPPEIEKSGWETIEYDEHWSATVVEIRPLPPALVAKRWAADLRRADADRASFARLAEDNAELVQKDTASLYIRQSMYCPASSASWDLPTGRALYLATKKRLHPVGTTSVDVSGRSDAGDFNVAMEELIANACRANPRLSPELIRTLEIRR